MSWGWSCSPQGAAFTTESDRLYTLEIDGVEYFVIYCLPDDDNNMLSPYVAFCKRNDMSDEPGSAWGHDDDPVVNKNGVRKMFTSHSESWKVGQ